MELEYEKEATDARGKIVFLAYGEKKVNIVEIKKGFSRGGHYHEFETTHHILGGKIQYKEKDLNSNKENTQVITAPATITVPAMTAHLLTAIEDTLFVEVFGNDYNATDYPEYRRVVTQNLQ